MGVTDFRSAARALLDSGDPAPGTLYRAVEPMYAGIVRKVLRVAKQGWGNTTRVILLTRPRYVLVAVPFPNRAAIIAPEGRDEETNKKLLTVDQPWLEVERSVTGAELAEQVKSLLDRIEAKL